MSTRRSLPLLSPSTQALRMLTRMPLATLRAAAEQRGIAVAARTTRQHLAMQLVSHALPPSPVFEVMRAIVAGHGVRMPALVQGGALTVAYLALACWFFGWIHRRAIRVGLIARYSAENVG